MMSLWFLLPLFPFLHLQGKKEMPRLAFLMKSNGGGDSYSAGSLGCPQGHTQTSHSLNKILLDLPVSTFLSGHSFHQILKGPWPKKDQRPEGLFHCSSSNVSRLCTSPQPSPTWFHQTGFTHQNEFAHFNGKSEWVQRCQRSYIIIISCLLLRFPCDIPNPDARDLCIPSMKLHKAEGRLDSKGMHRAYLRNQIY